MEDGPAKSACISTLGLLDAGPGVTMRACVSGGSGPLATTLSTCFQLGKRTLQAGLNWHGTADFWEGIQVDKMPCVFWQAKRNLTKTPHLPSASAFLVRI